MFQLLETRNWIASRGLFGGGAGIDFVLLKLGGKDSTVVKNKKINKQNCSETD